MMLAMTAFKDALDRCPPQQATACSGWTVHELTAHVAAGAYEISRYLTAAVNQTPPPTLQTLEEREAPFRAMSDGDLREALEVHTAELQRLLDAASAMGPDAVVPWVNREVPVGFFAMHVRSEASIHRWDLVGDDDVSADLLSRPELTTHAVTALGPLLLLRGAASPLDGTPFEIRLRSAGQPDVVLRAGASGPELTVAEDVDDS